MTSDILHKLLSQLNSSFKAQNRSLLLFIDSAGCHRNMENLVQQVAPGSGISTYLESDNELPTCYGLLTEQQLLEAIGTSHDVMEIESDEENEMEKENTPGEGERSNETTTLKSFKDVLDSVQNISAFLIHRGEFKVANEFSLLGDKLGEVAIQRRST